MVPFPERFKEVLGIHCDSSLKNNAVYLFESSWKKKYTDRVTRKILEKHLTQAGLKSTISPHKLRHFLFTWLKKQSIDDAFIQPFSGHESRKTLEIYSKLSISDAQEAYNEVINKFTI
jgi:integrase/recombinase XerD